MRSQEMGPKGFLGSLGLGGSKHFNSFYSCSPNRSGELPGHPSPSPSLLQPSRLARRGKGEGPWVDAGKRLTGEWEQSTGSGGLQGLSLSTCVTPDCESQGTGTSSHTMLTSAWHGP